MGRRIVGNAFRNALMNSHSSAGLPPGAELSDWLQAEKEIDSADQQAAPDKQFTR